jgi:choline dehydrogenase-like flavoprotein
MHDNPWNGVVDADCRVHGVPNLFIAGSSVFPTGGYANPTLTIVALAFRLATHLQSELQFTPRIQLEQRTSTNVNEHQRTSINHHSKIRPEFLRKSNG